MCGRLQNVFSVKILGSAARLTNPDLPGKGKMLMMNRNHGQTDAVQLRRAQTKGVITHVTVEIVSIRVTMVDLVR